jgi:hypothetical protein
VRPLRGGKGVYLISDSNGFTSAINIVKATDVKATDLYQRKHYFYLDSGMPRWHKWLIDDFDKDEQKEFKS